MHPDSLPMDTPMYSELSVTPWVPTDLYVCAYGWGDSLLITGWEGNLEGPATHDSTLYRSSTTLYPSSAANYGDDSIFRVGLGACVAAPPESVVVLAKISYIPSVEFNAGAFTLRGLDGLCSCRVTLRSGEVISATSAYSAIFKNINIYGNDPYPRPDPPLPHPPFPNRIQPVIAAIGVVTDFRTPFKADCWSYSIVDITIEQSIVGNASGTQSFLSLGAIIPQEGAATSMVEGFPKYDYQYFKPGDRIIFAAATFEEDRRRIAYDPFPVPYRIRWAEILLQPADDETQVTYEQSEIAPTYPPPSGSSVNGKYNASYIERTLIGTGSSLQDRITELLDYYGG